MKYELAIFDMDGTLYEFEGGPIDFSRTEAYSKIIDNGIEFIAQKLAVSRQKATTIRKAIVEKYANDISIGLEKEYGIDKLSYFNTVWNVDASKYVKYDPELKSLFESLSCKKAVLSAAPRIWVKRVLNQLQISDLVDEIWTGEGDIRKPSKEAYFAVVHKFGFVPAECVVLDDEIKNIKAAKAFGMGTIFVSNQASKEDVPEADHVIKNIYEIRNIM
jgi:putative hydrolase of the HAD superfamily